MHIVCLTMEIHLPGCVSLKEKRGRLKPLLTQLHKHFNVSAGEIDHQDLHRMATVACAVVTNKEAHGHRLMAKIPDWIESHRPDLEIVSHTIRPW